MFDSIVADKDLLPRKLNVAFCVSVNGSMIIEKNIVKKLHLIHFLYNVFGLILVVTILTQIEHINEHMHDIATGS